MNQLFRHALGGAFTALVIFAMPVQAAPEPRIKANTTPPVRKLDHSVGRIKVRITLRPGVPKANETISVEVELSEILDSPDPAFGRHKPLEGSELTATLVQAPAKRKAGKKATWIDRRTAVHLPDAGTYGMTFTPPGEGLFGLHIEGKTPAGPVNHSVVVSIGVWPIPEDAKPALLPKKLPEPTFGNLAHGRSLCEQHCSKNVSGALPAGGTPEFIGSAFAESHDDKSLLSVMTDGSARKLAALERLDLLFYLRSLHLRIRDFYPAASVYTFENFTINDHGLARLKEVANIVLPEDARSGKVFVIYKGETTEHPKLVPYADTVARDSLEKSNKIGYLLFAELAGEKKAKEMGLALGLETVYPIAALTGRAANGKVDSRFNRQLAGFVGQGRFNDAKSLRKGSSSLKKKLLPVYLKAAELATMYYAAEREFTAFDDEFK